MLYHDRPNPETEQTTADYTVAAGKIEEFSNIQEKGRALLAHARPIAHWFAPGTEHSNGCGEFAGD